MFRCLLWLCLVLSAVLPCPARGDAASGSNQFALELYRRLPRAQNVCFSPYSLSTALAMSYLGARGDTAREMARVLHLPPDAAAQLGELQKDLASGQGYELKVANRLWPAASSKLLPAYVQAVAAAFGAAPQPVDYSQADAAAGLINGWVEDQTAGKIRNLIPASLLGPATSLVLTNALYFKGRWASQFDPAATVEGDFQSPRGAVRARFMRQIGSFDYYEDARLQAISLPYAGGDLSMLILLPRSPSGLPEIELTPAELSGILDQLSPERVSLEIPRFRLETRMELGRELAALGMPRAFEPGADFSGLSGTPEPWRISAVLHQTFLEVNEEGTEASAATAVMITRDGGSRLVTFRADHPFLFLLRHRRTGAILFLGCLVTL